VCQAIQRGGSNYDSSCDCVDLLPDDRWYFKPLRETERECVTHQGSGNDKQKRDDRADRLRPRILENEATYAQREGTSSQANDEKPDFTCAVAIGCSAGEATYDICSQSENVAQAESTLLLSTTREKARHILIGL
jgi:hypothetical protein